MYVSQEWIIGEEEDTYPNHRQNNADRAKNGPGRCGAHRFLRKIHGLDGRVQQGEGIILTLGIRVHGESVIAWGERRGAQAVRMNLNPSTGERPFCCSTPRISKVN